MDEYLRNLAEASIKVTNLALLKSATRDNLEHFAQRYREERPPTEAEIEQHYSENPHETAIGLMHERTPPALPLSPRVAKALKFSIGNCIEFACICALLLHIACLTYPIPLPQFVTIQIGYLRLGDHAFCIVTGRPKYPVAPTESPQIMTDIVDAWSPTLENRIMSIKNFINYVNLNPSSFFSSRSDGVDVEFSLNQLHPRDFERCVHLLTKYSLLHMLETEIRGFLGASYRLDPTHAILLHKLFLPSFR